MLTLMFVISYRHATLNGPYFRSERNGRIPSFVRLNDGLVLRWDQSERRHFKENLQSFNIGLCTTFCDATLLPVAGFPFTLKHYINLRQSLCRVNWKNSSGVRRLGYCYFYRHGHITVEHNEMVENACRL